MPALGTPYPFLPLELYDGNGNPLSSGTITFLAAGTATPLATFQDSALTIANTNPVVLDAAGRWVQGVYLQPVGYKIVIRDQFGVIIATYDNVFPSNAIGSIASSTIATAGVVTALPLPANSGGDLVIYMTNPTLTTIQGIAAGQANQGLTIIATGAGQVDLANQNVGAAAATRLMNFATSANTSLSPPLGTGTGGEARFIYDAVALRWRMVAHDQGTWITPAFNAANYTASAGTWTLQAGDVTANAYRLSGKTLQWNLNLVTTSVSNAGVNLIAAIPGGFMNATVGFQLTRSSDNGAAVVVGIAQLINGTASVLLASTVVGVGYAIAANTTAIQVLLTLEVT
jgi:hypothetical protein